MVSNAVRDIRKVLERVRKAAVTTIDALLDPYRELLEKEPGAAIGSPREIPFFEWDTRIGKMAERVFDAGGHASPLFEAEQWVSILDQLVTDYRAGVYSITTVKAWFEMLERLRKDALAVIDAALEETSDYEKIDFGPATSTPKSGLEKDILTPEDLVADLGIQVPAIRKRIRQGHLGPWRQEGGRWMILRREFEKWLAEQSVQMKVDRGSSEAKRRADVLRLLERHPRRRGRGGGKKTSS